MKNMRILIHLIFLLFLSMAFAQWEPDVRLTFADEHSNMSSNNARGVATNGDTVHVVWTDGRDGNGEIYYKHSLDAGSNWGSDTRLTDDPAISGLPTIAISGLTIHVAWFDTRDSGNFEIYYKRSQDGGITWGPDTRLTYDIYYSWYPSIGLSNANVHLVWRESRAGNYEIFYKRSTDEGTTWGPDTNLSNASGSSETPCIAVSDSTLHVLWFDNRDGGAYEIYYKRSTDEGTTWEPDVRLTDDPGVSFGPCVAVVGLNVHVIWQDYRDGNWELYYKLSQDGGTTWGSDIRLTDALETSESPSVAASGSNVHVVWWDNRDNNYEIYYKRSLDNGTTWDPDTRLTDEDSWSQFPHIALADTILHVVWEDGRIGVGNNELFYKRNPTGNPGGIEEEKIASIRNNSFGATIISGPLLLPEGKVCKIFDITGRSVASDKLRSGIYFIEIDKKIIHKIIKIK